MDHQAEDPQPTESSAAIPFLASAGALILDRLRKGDPAAPKAWRNLADFRAALVKLGGRSDVTLDGKSAVRFAVKDVKRVPPLIQDPDLPRDFQLQTYTIRDGKATHRPELDTPRLTVLQTMDALRSIARAHYAQGIKGEILTDECEGETSRFQVFKYAPGAYFYPTEADFVDAIAVMICPLDSYWKAEFSFKEAGAVFVHRPDLDIGPVTHQALNRTLAGIEQAWRSRGAELHHKIEDGAEQVIRYVIPEGESGPEGALEIRIIEIPPLVGEAS